MSVTFAYTARTPSGERVAGTMRALDRSAALAILRDRLLVPSRLELTTHTPVTAVLRRAKPSERLAFFRAYAGWNTPASILAAFALLIEQAKFPRMRDALASIRADVERGGTNVGGDGESARRIHRLEVAMSQPAKKRVIGKSLRPLGDVSRARRKAAEATRRGPSLSSLVFSRGARHHDRARHLSSFRNSARSSRRFGVDETPAMSRAPRHRRAWPDGRWLPGIVADRIAAALTASYRGPQAPRRRASPRAPTHATSDRRCRDP